MKSLKTYSAPRAAGHESWYEAAWLLLPTRRNYSSKQLDENSKLGGYQDRRYRSQSSPLMRCYVRILQLNARLLAFRQRFHATMGATPSQPAVGLEVLGDNEQRTLLRNFQMMASHDSSSSSTFSLQDFTAIHASMTPALASALFRAVDPLQTGAGIDCDSVIGAVAAARAHGPSSSYARSMVYAAVAPCTDPVQFVDSLRDVLTSASRWLASVGSSSPPELEGELIPPPSHALSSHDDFSQWATGHAAYESAAAVLVQTLQMAWLTDLRELKPLPVLTEGSSTLLGTPELRVLARALPAEHRLRWRLLFSGSRDGMSFSRLVSCVNGRPPCVLVIRDSKGATFGGFWAAPLRISPKFQGGFGCFLFRLSPEPQVFPASGDNGNYVYFNYGMDQLPNGIAFGGQIDAQYFGLWLKDDLETGRSCAPCSTYGSDCLASDSEFTIREVEIWAVEDDPPVDEESNRENPLVASGVLAPKHAETRAFLSMAGKELPSAQARGGNRD